MTLPSHAENSLTLALIEGCLALIATVLAFSWPRVASGPFSRIESVFRQLAHRKGLAIVVVGLTTLVLRIAILPFVPVPLPFLPDDFSFLFASDTFVSGRLANPTPAMWTHFETIHITMFPTYTSMYFPAQGLLLAASKVLFGHPWIGVLLVDALMCSAICWMLQAWLPPTWALLGAMLAILRLGLFSYWINTYTGGGLIAALGGALLLGSLPRVRKNLRLRYGIAIAIGVVLLATTRPYEGLLLCIPVAVALGHWIFFGESRPAPAVLFRYAALPVLLVIAAGAWMAYYDYRAFGKPQILPYTIDRATYAVAPYYVWQSQRPEPVYRHAVLRDFYVNEETKTYKKVHNLVHFIPVTVTKPIAVILFFAGFSLLFPVIMLRRAMMDRRIRFLVLCVLVLMAGMAIEIYLIPHYLAPFTAALYAIGLQAMRHLRVWKPGGQPVGMAIVRYSVVLCCVMGALRLAISPLHIEIEEWPGYQWSSTWYGPDHYGTERARIEEKLESLPGKQLVMVRYSPDHYAYDEWVYNSPDIDNSKVIWAREMDAANNRDLTHYYSDRHVWLVQPDLPQGKLSSYPAPGNLASAGQ